jgi:hypothetical protein
MTRNYPRSLRTILSGTYRLAYTLSLRRGLRFSDGHAFDADDVVFTLKVLLDPAVGAPHRDLLVVGGKPIAVTKVDAYTVRLTLAEPYAAAERLFDSIAILPRHLLESAYAQGTLSGAWTTTTGPASIAGLGPYRLKQHVAGQEIVLERNPYYWKVDSANRRLPYIDEIVFVFAGNEDAQVIRFQSGASDLLGRTTADNFALLSRDQAAKRYQLKDLGPSLEYNFRRGRRLVVVPHGPLHYVPFHALYDGEQYVTDSCAVSYAPSASIYARCQQQASGGGEGALVLGVADDQAPLIDAEARAVAAVLPDARLCIGPDATEQVLRTSGRNSRIVHIASHGYFRPENPMFSGIRLGDAYLNVYDLYRLRLKADLVTLSGCATGANVAAAGDELLGITRGLFCAGAHTLLLSLWNVHDESTAALMTQLYRRIAAGAAPVDALRDTMRDFRSEHSHPYYWAPFVLTGKSGQI